MRIKEKLAGIICCAVMLYLFVCCPVLAEESPDGQGARTLENEQNSVSADQMSKTAALQPADWNAGGERTGGRGTDRLKEISGTVILSD